MATTVTLNVHSVARVSMAVVRVTLDSVETRVNFSTAQVRTKSVCTTFSTSVSSSSIFVHNGNVICYDFQWAIITQHT